MTESSANDGVEKLCMNGEYPVERATTKFFSVQIACGSAQSGGSAAHSYFVSLDRKPEARRIALSSFNPNNRSDNVRHSFERIIAGRCYLIEVAMVDQARWRANLLKLPGVPAAMMPFYGATPDEAATNLTDWLDRAHQHHAGTA